jgi:hypothetical protein
MMGLMMGLIGELMSVIFLVLILCGIAEYIGKIGGTQECTTSCLLGMSIGYILPPIFYFLLG